MALPRNQVFGFDLAPLPAFLGTKQVTQKTRMFRNAQAMSA
jgi:hypothetical protein